MGIASEEPWAVNGKERKEAIIWYLRVMHPPLMQGVYTLAIKHGNQYFRMCIYIYIYLTYILYIYIDDVQIKMHI